MLCLTAAPEKKYSHLTIFDISLQVDYPHFAKRRRSLFEKMRGKD